MERYFQISAHFPFLFLPELRVNLNSPLLKTKVLFGGFNNDLGDIDSDEELNGFSIQKCNDTTCIVESTLSDIQIRAVVIDLSLNDASGLDAAARLRKACERELFIIGVGWFSISSNMLAYMNGCDEFISKPFDLKFILELICDKLGQEPTSEPERTFNNQKNNKVH